MGLQVLGWVRSSTNILSLRDIHTGTKFQQGPVSEDCLPAEFKTADLPFGRQGFTQKAAEFKLSILFFHFLFSGFLIHVVFYILNHIRHPPSVAPSVPMHVIRGIKMSYFVLSVTVFLNLK